MRIIDDGEEYNIEVLYFYDGEDYRTDFISKGVTTEFDLKTSARKSAGYDRKNMFSGDKSLQVHANVRQDSDSDWMIKGAQWKTQVYLPKNGIWLGSYHTNDRKDRTVVSEYKEKEIGRGIWKFGDAPNWDIIPFDPASIPNNIEIDGLNEWTHAYKFADGRYWVETYVSAIDSEHFY